MTRLTKHDLTKPNQVTIPENVPYGTPLANLNMEIKDTDTGTNSVFRVELKDPPPGFTIEPQRATGHTAVSLKINKVKLKQSEI